MKHGKNYGNAECATQWDAEVWVDDLQVERTDEAHGPTQTS